MSSTAVAWTAGMQLFHRLQSQTANVTNSTAVAWTTGMDLFHRLQSQTTNVMISDNKIQRFQSSSHKRKH